jgi:hypothetical protein
MSPAFPYDVVAAADRKKLFQLLGREGVPRKLFDLPQQQVVLAFLQTCDLDHMIRFINERLSNGAEILDVIAEIMTIAEGIVETWSQKGGKKVDVKWETRNGDEGDKCQSKSWK